MSSGNSILDTLGIDATALLNAIGAPIASAINSGLSSVINSISSAFSFLSNIGSQISNGFTQYFVPALQNVFSPIVSFLQSLPQNIVNGLSGIGQSIGNFLVAASNGFGQTIQSVGQTLNAGLVQPLASFFNGLIQQFYSVFSPVANVLTNIPGSISTILSQFGNSVLSGFNQVAGLFSSIIQQSNAFLVNGASAFSQGLTNLGTSFQNFGAALATAFGNFGASTWNALNTQIIQPFTQGLQSEFNSIYQSIIGFNDTIKNTLLTNLPRTPDAAFNSALIVAETGIATLAAGELAALGLEALYPTKHLGIPEALHKITDILGISAIGGALYGIVIESSWGLQLKYYFNFNLQPVLPDPQTVQKAVYYKAATLDQYATSLQYEGLNADAIAMRQATIYEPLPTRILRMFIDNGVFSDAFFSGELEKTGLDPANTPTLLAAFKQLKIAQYQSQAKSIIHDVYSHGYLNQDLAINVLNMTQTPPDQITLILYLANIAAQDALNLAIEAEILAEVKKNTIAPADAVGILTGLGLSNAMADAKVKLAAVQAAPTPTKDQRNAILQAALSIPLVSA